MKIFSRDQIYKGDKLTAKKQGITSTELMERAGTNIFDWMHKRMQGAQVPIHVFCGIGNNGGDGLVIGRHLINHGYNVYVYIINYSDKRSKDFLINYERIKNTTKNWPDLLTNDEDLPAIGKDDIIVDAVFGIGLNRPPVEWVINIFKHFKESGAFTLSVDIPSGLCDDQVPVSEDAVVWADHTLSFQSPKLVFFLPQTAKYTKRWEILDIGIDRDFLNTTDTTAELITKVEILSLYKPRDKFSHKGNFGHVLLIGGSLGKIGAVILAAKAALSTGAGLVSVYIPSGGNIIVQTSIPEAMTIIDKNENEISEIKVDIDYTMAGIGPGLGQSKISTKAMADFLKVNKKPLVIDADALNILSRNKALIKDLPKNSVFTPHPKELERIIGSWENDFEKLKKTQAFAKKHNLIILIKGAHTITVTADKFFINTTGNQGLATAGTGDVLTGVISSLIAQGYTPLEACLFGVYLHGRSADLIVENLGYQALLASHVVEGLSKAYLDLFKKPEEGRTESNQPTDDEE